MNSSFYIDESDPTAPDEPLTEVEVDEPSWHATDDFAWWLLYDWEFLAEAAAATEEPKESAR